jgi:CBS domain-containing protein
MKIKDIMTRDVEVIHPDSVIQEAAGKMKTLNIGSLPVCDNRRLLGVLTDRDIAIRAVASGREMQRLKGSPDRQERRQRSMGSRRN